MSNNNYGQQLLILAIFLMILMGIVTLWKTSILERGVPLYNIGFILITVNLLYSIYPYFDFWMTDFQWTDISDSRFRAYEPTALEM